MSEETQFQKYLPKLTEVTSVKAAQSYGAGGEIISLNGKRVGIDAFMLVLADDEKQFGPFVLTNVSGRALFQRLSDEGFGAPT
jgi:hypothetical protein